MAASLALSAVLVLAFWPVIVRQQSLLPRMSGVSPEKPGPRFVLDPMAPAWFSYPLGVLAHRIWSRGELPLWNSFSSCGEPLLAGVHAGVTSPLRSWLLVSPPTPALWDFYCILRLLLAGTGALWLGKSLGFSVFPALVCSVAYMLSGFLAANVCLSMLDAEVLLPVLAACIVRFIRAPSLWLWLGCAAAGGGILMLGNPQVALVDGAFASGLGAVAAWRLRREGGLRRAAALAAGGICALMLAAPALLPVMEFLPRAQHIHAEAGRTALPLWGSLSLAVPWLLGSFGESWGGLNPFLFLPYAGFGVLVLAVTGAAKAWRFPCGPALCLTPVVMLGATYGLPPASWLGHLPGVSLLWWAKYQAPTYLCLAILAGFGLPILAGWIGGKKTDGRIALAIALLISAELLLLMPVSRPKVHDPLISKPYLEYLADHMHFQRDRLYATGEWLQPQAGAALGFPDVRSFYGVMPRRAYWYMRALVTGPAKDSHAALTTGSSDAWPAIASPALSALAVRWIVTDAAALGGRMPANLLLRFRGEALVFENPGVRPRARIVGRAVKVQDAREALYETSAAPAGDCAFIEGPSDWPGFDLSGSEAGAAEIEEEGPNHIVCKVPGKGARVLLLADTWERGWKAWASSRRLRVLPANCMFRAVAVPAGERRVTFRYDPGAVKFGFLAAGLSAGLCMGFLGCMLASGKRRIRSWS